MHPKGEDKEVAYMRAITQRADKIVATLGIADSAKAARVRDIITQQYLRLSRIHDARDVQIKAAKEKAGDDKAAANASIQSRARRGQAEARQPSWRIHCETFRRAFTRAGGEGEGRTDLRESFKGLTTFISRCIPN